MCLDFKVERLRRRRRRGERKESALAGQVEEEVCAGIGAHADR